MSFFLIFRILQSLEFLSENLQGKDWHIIRFNTLEITKQETAYLFCKIMGKHTAWLCRTVAFPPTMLKTRKQHTRSRVLPLLMYWWCCREESEFCGPFMVFGINVGSLEVIVL